MGGRGMARVFRVRNALTMAYVDVIRVMGGGRLAGDVSVGGAKNSALKLMAAALLATGRSVLTNVPRITDIAIMAEVLRRLGCEVEQDEDRGVIPAPQELRTHAAYDPVPPLPPPTPPPPPPPP